MGIIKGKQFTTLSTQSLNRDGRFGSKVGQIGPKWDKSGSIWGQSDPLWSQTYHPCLCLPYTSVCSLLCDFLVLLIHQTLQVRDGASGGLQFCLVRGVPVPFFPESCFWLSQLSWAVKYYQLLFVITGKDRFGPKLGQISAKWEKS